MAWQGMLRYGNGRPLGGLAVGCMAQMGRWSPDISQSTISMSAILYHFFTQAAEGIKKEVWCMAIYVVPYKVKYMAINIMPNEVWCMVTSISVVS